jgi:hypothetical protein
MPQSDNRYTLNVFFASFASLALLCFCDYISSYEMHFFVFFFVPVSLCAWFLPRRLPVVIMAAVGGVSWGVMDKLAGHTYSSDIIWYWNIGGRFASFLIIGLVLQRLRRLLLAEKKARLELEQALEQQRRATAEIQKLQSQLQVVCAWTKRIKIDGKWITMEEFLQNQLHLHFTHGISPEAIETVEKQMPQPTSAHGA